MNREMERDDNIPDTILRHSAKNTTLFLLLWRITPKPARVVPPPPPPPQHTYTHAQSLLPVMWGLCTQLHTMWEALSYSFFFILLEGTARTDGDSNAVLRLCVFCLSICLSLSHPQIILKTLHPHQQTPDQLCSGHLCPQTVTYGLI